MGPPRCSRLKRSSLAQAPRKRLALTSEAYTPPDPRPPDKPWQTKAADSDEDVRYFAADALGNVRTAAVMQAIETRLAAETSPVVRSALLAAKNKLDRAASR